MISGIFLTALHKKRQISISGLKSDITNMFSDPNFL